MNHAVGPDSAPDVGRSADGDGANDADLIRSAVGSILGRDASNAILAPGALVALRLLFRQLGVESVVLSDREYYAPEHFPACDVRISPIREIPTVVEEESPDAVIVSLVSWRGDVAELSGLARSLRHSSATREDDPDGVARPLLCVDWCHAGALGFPPVGDLDADLIFGDATKWLIPVDTPDRLAFLLGSEPIQSVLDRCFAGLYLSGRGRTEREARWIDPQTLAAMARSVNGNAGDRAELDARHARNRALALTVAKANQLPAPDTAILWIPGAARRDLDLTALPSEGLAWDTEGGVRVLCQASP